MEYDADARPDDLLQWILRWTTPFFELLHRIVLLAALTFAAQAAHSISLTVLSIVGSLLLALWAAQVTILELHYALDLERRMDGMSLRKTALVSVASVLFALALVFVLRGAADQAIAVLATHSPG